GINGRPADAVTVLAERHVNRSRQRRYVGFKILSHVLACHAHSRNLQCKLRHRLARVLGESELSQEMRNEPVRVDSTWPMQRSGLHQVLLVGTEQRERLRQSGEQSVCCAARRG